MKRVLVVTILICGVFLAGFNRPVKAQSCIAQCQNDSTKVAIVCVAAGGSEAFCTQMAGNWYLDCVVDCVVP